MLHALARCAVLVTAALFAPCAAVEARASSLDLATCVCACLADGYVFPDRLVSAPMMEAACSSFQSTDGQFTATWTSDGLVAVRSAHATSRSILARAMPRTVQQVGTLIDDIGRWAAANGLPAEECLTWERAMIATSLRVLDPYSTILPPARARVRNENSAGSFGGIGANLRDVDDRLIFDGVRPSLPAERAGMRDGDRLIGIAGTPVGGLTLDGAVARIRGAPGTTVSLHISRAGRRDPISLDVVRTVVPAVTMRAMRLGDVGYIRLDGFTATSAAEVRRAFQDLATTGHLAAVVLDLRHNGGGVMEQACEISSQLLPRHSAIIEVVGGDRPSQTYRTSVDPIVAMPLIVLVSRSTASAAEILAGTLQCHGRALLIGSLTHGKGLIQAIRDLPDGSQCVYSVREYRLPGGLRVQGIGIVPDLALERCAGDDSPGACVCSPGVASRERFRASPHATLSLPEDAATTPGIDDLLDPAFTPDQLVQGLVHALGVVGESTVADCQSGNAVALDHLVTAWKAPACRLAMAP
jgi:C-terminal peptidase prc